MPKPHLSDERRGQLIAALKHYFEDEFDDRLSDYRAAGLLDFFIAQLGPPLYNQGVRDAVGHMQHKLTDIEGEVFAREVAP